MFTQLVVISYITRRISGYVSRIKSRALLSHGTGTCQDDTNGLDAEGSMKTN